MPFSESFDPSSLVLTVTGSDSIGQLQTYKDQATKIVCEGDFKTISNNAFKDYAKVTSIELPDSITSIEDNIIENDNCLLSLTLPRNVRITRFKTFLLIKITLI